MKKRGFTLIELLAVIVVLAIIALIATPLVLNTIEEARKGSAKSSGYSYISGVETGLASYVMKNSGKSYTAGLYDVFTITTDLEIELKGEAPSEGNICIGSDGIITNASLKINNYVVSYDGKETTITDSGEIEDISCESEIALAGDPILDKVKALVYAEDGETCKIDADATDTTTYKYMGGCYIKGASTNNYVWYNGFMWRIMGINSDRTVRLITDENVTALAYGKKDTEFTYETNEGYVHDWLNEYFYKNLNRTKNIIKTGEYFCSETTTDASNIRSTCENGKIRTKVGLISLDEYNLAGSSSSYLNIKQDSWTMTPRTGSYVWRLRYNNSIDYPTVERVSGIRPIINVSSNAVITSGQGTTSNFYVLGEDKQSSTTGTIREKATSGEYVSLEGKTYRVVSKNTNGVKLILDGFYEETEDEIYTMAYGTDNTFNLESGIGSKLNGDVLKWLGLANSDSKIVATTYYQGDAIATGTYTAFLSKANGIDGVKVGLIQIGEMLSGQSSTMITNNPYSYWVMNKYSDNSNGWYIDNYGTAFHNAVNTAYAIRPVIVVSKDLTINDGNGTLNGPYQI